MSATFGACVFIATLSATQAEPLSPERLAARGPAAVLSSGAEVSLLRAGNLLDSGIVAGLDETGLRLVDPPNGEISIPWSEISAVARVHRTPPAAGQEPRPGDAVVLGRAAGGVYRGSVASSDATAVSLSLAGVKSPVVFSWTAIAAWACGDASAPLPVDWMPDPSRDAVLEREAALAVPEPDTFFTSLEVFRGSKTLSGKYWGTAASQTELGASVTIGPRAWPVYLTAGHARSRHEGSVFGAAGETRETYAGVRRNLGDFGGFGPWVGGGAALFAARRTNADGSVDGTGYGVWTGAGADFRLNEVLRGGIAFRLSIGNVDLGGTEVAAGGTHVVLSISFGSDGR